jgi:acetate---CoA ligase (ADP-forming)
MFRIIPEGLAFREHVLLKDGQGVFLKPATEKDIPLVGNFMKRISRESLRMRFMASISEVSSTTIKNLCSGDFKQEGCLLAIIGETKYKRVIGLGNYIATGDGHTAEVAFLIQDTYQGRGISTILLERLAGLAAANGFIDFEAEVLPDNQPMMNVFKSSGFEKHRVWGSDTVHFELPVKGGAQTWEISQLRERIAVANSLNPLLNPKTIAVIGVSRGSSSIGYLIFKNILNAGFNGEVFPVNPLIGSIDGIRAYSSSRELPKQIDLAVIVVRAEKVYEVAKEAIDAGAKGLVVVSAGFSDAGEEGKQRQKNLVELVRTNGVRLLGPSCLGLMNTNPAVKLNASLAPQIMIQGQSGFFSHSAALGLVILDYAKEKGLGFSTFVSAGNRADVSGNDLLLYWEEDPETKFAILYLETFGNPRRFVRIARRMSYKKPILCVKGARSSAGKKTVEAKSGASVGGEREVEALFQQTGIILAPNLEDIFDVAVVLAHQPLPMGNRVSIIANSSGMATIFADACEMNELEINEPGVIDLGAFTSPDKYEEAVLKAHLSKKVDSLLVGFACVGNCDTNMFADAIKEGISKAEKKTGQKKPVLLCLMGAAGTISLIDENNSNHRKFPSFRFPELAVNALGRIVQYVDFKKQPLGNLVWYNKVDAAKARQLVQQILSGETSEDKVMALDKNSSIEFLKYFGIKTTSEQHSHLDIVKVKIKPDPLFGPLLEIKVSDYNTILRITPITDRDLEETLQQIRCSKEGGLSQTIGKLSQMIEEIPWLWELDANVVLEKKPLVISDVIIKIKTGKVERPNY